MTRSGAPKGATAAAAQSNHGENAPSARPAGEPCLACGRVRDHANWCGPEYLAQERVAIPTTAPPVPERMLAKQTIGAVRAGSDLEAAKAWKPPDIAPPSTSERERDLVVDRIIQLRSARATRADAYRERIRRTASWLGREVHEHRVTSHDARARVERLLLALDQQTAVPVLMVPWREAESIASDALTATFGRRISWLKN